MQQSDQSVPPPAAAARRQLNLAIRGWFGATLLGQLLFAAFILLYYYPSTLSGDYSAWNNKPLITGYVASDAAGNRQFAVHVLAAAALTLSGLLQLVPAVRSRWPRLHRWSGRLFLTSALVLALGGLWLVWARGTYLTLTGAFAISLDGALIVAFSLLAWFHARQRNFAQHRRWALRAFIVASGVWFMRVGYMAWGITTRGAGIAKGMSGPFDLFWGFATYLLPLAVLELYLRAERGVPRAQYAMAAGLWLASLAILGGSAAAWMMIWWPFLH
jgi:hypothetical protein